MIAIILGGGAGNVAAQDPSARVPSVQPLIDWLDNPETEWVATARLQAVPQTALPLLLRPGRVASGPHDRWTAPMLALSKIGEPAIPAIVDRVLTILRTRNTEGIAAAHPLIKVLGSIGPHAIPALVQVAEESGTPSITSDALDEIVRLEPRTSVYGQYPSPWIFWRVADDRANELARQLVPLLPRVRRVMDRAVSQWKPQSTAPQRLAAYLLARWGTGELQSRGHQVLVDVAEANEPFYYTMESIRLLHGLNAPETAALIRSTAARVPENNDLRGQYLLGMVTALHQLGDVRYTDLVDVPLHDSSPYVRMDAARFVASTSDIANATRLVPLLEDHAQWNGRQVATVALESLRRLTLQELAPDASLWRTWLDRHKGLNRAEVSAALVKSRSMSIAEVPMKQATEWINELDGADGSTNLALIDGYLRRSDLDASTIGGGSGPVGMYAPQVVTLLLGMVQRSVPGAMQRLELFLDAASPDVRMFSALALSAYNKQRAIEALVKEANSPEAWHRSRAAEFLLQLGDKRGIPARLDALESDQDAARLFACRDLRVYTQLPLPCDAWATAAERAAQVSGWREWWNESGQTFHVRSREAELDLQVFPFISPVSIGGRSVR